MYNYMRLSKFVTVFALCACSAVQAGVESCTDMLVGTPGSVEARACFARELAALNVQMTTVVKAIAREAESGRTAFNAKDLADSQTKWKQHVDSTCWLDATGAGNSDAVLDHCVSVYTLQRLGQLKNLRAGLDGKPALWPMSNLDHAK